MHHVRGPTSGTGRHVIVTPRSSKDRAGRSRALESDLSTCATSISWSGNDLLPGPDGDAGASYELLRRHGQPRQGRDRTLRVRDQQYLATIRPIGSCWACRRCTSRQVRGVDAVDRVPVTAADDLQLEIASRRRTFDGLDHARYRDPVRSASPRYRTQPAARSWASARPSRRRRSPAVAALRRSIEERTRATVRRNRGPFVAVRSDPGLVAPTRRNRTRPRDSAVGQEARVRTWSEAA